MIRSRTFGGVRQVIALVSWAEIEAIEAEINNPGEQVSCLKLIFGQEPKTLADLVNPSQREKLIGKPLAHYSAPNNLVQRLTEDEWKNIIEPQRGNDMLKIRRPWMGDFNLLPFSDPGALKIVAEHEFAFREIQHDGICYRSTPGDYADFSYRMIENMVC